MAHDPARAALALLAVLVVLFAGALFPAAGFGDYPPGAREPGLPAGGTGGSVSGDATPTSPAAGSGGADATGTPTTSDDDDGTPTTTAAGSESTATDRPTTTTTATPTPVSNAGGGGGLVDLVAGVVVLGLLLLGGFLVAPLGSPGGGGVRVAGIDLPSLQLRLRGALAAIPRRTMTGLVGFSASVPELLDRAGTLAAAVGDALGLVVGGTARGALASARLLGSGLAGALVVAPRALGSGLDSMLDGLSRTGGSLSRTGSGDAGDGDGRTGDADDEEVESEPFDPQTVAEAWAAMVERLPHRSRPTATPREIAATAIDAGLPAEPVRRLTRAFEEVRYGGYEDESRLEAARRAASAIVGGDRR